MPWNVFNFTLNFNSLLSATSLHKERCLFVPGGQCCKVHAQELDVDAKTQRRTRLAKVTQRPGHTYAPRAHDVLETSLNAEPLNKDAARDATSAQRGTRRSISVCGNPSGRGAGARAGSGGKARETRCAQSIPATFRGGKEKTATWREITRRGNAADSRASRVKRKEGRTSGGTRRLRGTSCAPKHKHLLFDCSPIFSKGFFLSFELGSQPASTPSPSPASHPPTHPHQQYSPPHTPNSATHARTH